MDCGLEQSELYAYQQCGSACTMFVTTAPNFEMGICNHTSNSLDIVTVVKWKSHPDNWSGFGAICDTCTTLVNIQLMQFMKLLFQTMCTHPVFSNKHSKSVSAVFKLQLWFFHKLQFWFSKISNLQFWFLKKTSKNQQLLEGYLITS
jgi:hypothetical protein